MTETLDQIFRAELVRRTPEPYADTHPGYRMFESGWAGDTKDWSLCQQAADLGYPRAMAAMSDHPELTLAKKRHYLEQSVRCRSHVGILEYLIFLIQHEPAEAAKYLHWAQEIPGVKGPPTNLSWYIFNHVDNYYSRRYCQGDIDGFFHYLFTYDRFEALKRVIKHQPPNPTIVHYFLQMTDANLSTDQRYMKDQHLEIMWLRFHLSPTYFQQRSINRDIWGLIISYFHG